MVGWAYLPLRRAYFRLERLFKDGTLFCFLDPELTIPVPVPRDGNRLEGGLNTAPANGFATCCLCSMFLRQVGRCFPAVGAAGFPQCWQCVWAGGLYREGIGPPDLYIPEL